MTTRRTRARRRRRRQCRQRRHGRGDTYGGDQEEEKSGTLDADGKLQITIPTKVDSKKQDLVYRIEARVTDAGNREIAGHGFALATYGSFFLTAEPNSYVYSKGSTATITVTAQDYDKKPVQTAFRVEMNRWNWRKGAGPTVTTSQGQTDADRQSAGQADDSRLRRISRAHRRNHAREARRREHTLICGRRARARGGAAPTQERIQIVADKKSLSAGRHRARADRHRQRAGVGAGHCRR